MKAKKDDITHKLKIARGQIDGILQMIEEDRYCVDISTQLQSVQALLKSVNQQILQAHIRNCVREALQTDAENPNLPAKDPQCAVLRVSTFAYHALYKG